MHMLGIFGTSHKEDPENDKTLEDTAEALETPATSVPQSTEQFTDKTLEERERETRDLQATYTHLREATSKLLHEEHPEVERTDTVEKAHERGEI